MKECPLLFTIFNTLNPNSSWNYLEYKNNENGIYKWNKNSDLLLAGRRGHINRTSSSN